MDFLEEKEQKVPRYKHISNRVQIGFEKNGFEFHLRSSHLHLMDDRSINRLLHYLLHRADGVAKKKYIYIDSYNYNTVSS